MAYGFNNDKSKAEVYSKSEIDALLPTASDILNSIKTETITQEYTTTMNNGSGSSIYVQTGDKKVIAVLGFGCSGNGSGISNAPLDVNSIRYGNFAGFGKSFLCHVHNRSGYTITSWTFKLQICYIDD